MQWLRRIFTFVLLGAMALLTSCGDKTVEVPEDTTWQRTYGGTGNDVAADLVATPDGNYLIVGYTTSSGAGDSDIYLIKINEMGNIIWERTPGTELPEEGHAACKTSDGGFVIAGSRAENPLLMKIDTSGTIEWQQDYDYSAGLRDYVSVTSSDDGGFLFVGSRKVERETSMFAVKTDAAGTVEWDSTYEKGILNCVYSVGEGKFIAAGMLDLLEDLFGMDTEMFVLEIDQLGTPSQTSIGDAGGWDSWANCGIPTEDGRWIFAGATWAAFEGGYDIKLVKLAYPYLSRIDWVRVFGDQSMWDEANDICPATDGGYVLAGSRGSNALMTKMDESGNAEWNRTFGGDMADEAIACTPTSDGGYLILANTSSFGAGETDIYVIKTDANGNAHEMPSRSE
jgi:hypothetical protein